MTLKKSSWTFVNNITVLRMVGAIAMLFIRPMSKAFYIVYLLTGLTDVLDGWIARKTGTTSELGAKLDSLADILFYTIMMILFLPILSERLPVQIWYVVVVIIIIRLLAYFIAALKYKCFASLHTWLNKLTGLGVFILPFVFIFSPGILYSWILCGIAFLSSIEELIIHIVRNRYSTNIKSILNLLSEGINKMKKK